MKLIKFKPFHLVALAAAFALPAHADIRRPLVDSTGVRQGVTATMVMPAAGLTEKDVKTIIDNRDLSGGGSGASTVPAGYTEVVTAMVNNRYLGRDDAGQTAAGYYVALGYPITTGSDCGANTSQRILVNTVAAQDTSDGTTTPGYTDYRVCEPQGSRSVLVKTVGSQLLNVNLALLSTKIIAPAIGLSLNGATPFCQSQGYVNYVPGTIVVNAPGACDQQITRWNGSAYYNDNACYNSILYSMQCWK